MDLGIILIVMTIFVLAQVYFRFFTEASLTWSEELCRFLLIWMTFTGSAIALRRNEHIQIDNLPRRATHWRRTFILFIRGCLMIGFLFSMFYGSLSLMEITGFQQSPSMGISMTYVYVVIPLSSVLMVLLALVQLVKSFTPAKRRLHMEEVNGRIHEEMIQ
jgi:TRAP-type C4-dicarboxylate transport system permease small subunit